METAISIPDKVFEAAEDFARRRKMTRSALFSTAVEEYIQHHRQDNVTEQLNKVYADQSSSLDPVLQRLQSSTIPREEW